MTSVPARGTPTSSLPPSFGVYRPCLELASGGMATVYLAHAGGVGSGTFAALKVIHPHLLSDARFAEMFVDEAEIASRIRHPNVCRVFDFEVGPQTAYMSMEYLVGVSMAKLQRKLESASDRDASRDARMICRALADACEGLHAAHELTDADGVPLDVVHRDVSPGNLMLTFDGVAKVVDFGVASAARKRHRTQTGMLKGKFAYIAPEYLLGRKADRRADVWGVGVIAWELLTGARLFRRDTDADTLRAVMDEEALPPSAARPELPEELDAILARALARDPAERYPTARELGRDLARFANREEVVVHADLAEWLQALFPGAHARQRFELERAEQAAEASGERRRPSSLPPPEIEPTRLYERVTLASPPPLPTPPLDRPSDPVARPSRASTPWLVAGALVVGCLMGGITSVLASRAAAVTPPETPAPDIPAEPPPTVEPTAPPPPTPRLQLQAGVGVASGPYVIEVGEAEGDALVLRIRREGVEAPLERADDGVLRVRRRAPVTAE